MLSRQSFMIGRLSLANGKKLCINNSSISSCSKILRNSSSVLLSKPAKPTFALSSSSSRSPPRVSRSSNKWKDSNNTIEQSFSTRASTSSFYQPGLCQYQTLLRSSSPSSRISFHPMIRCLSSSNPNQSGKGGGFPPPKGRGRFGAGMSVLGTSALVLMGKGKYILGALKLTKFASLGSMVFTIGTYSMFFGLPYASGIVGLTLVHESGHALVMRHLGIPFSPMVFMPFLGAAVTMKKTPRDAYDEALVAFGGPYLGTAGAVGVSAAAVLTDSQLLYAVADFGYMINLFNMLPIGMMDGGRICGALSPYAGLAGLGIGGGMIGADMISNPIFYLIMLGGAWTTFQRFYYPGQDLPKNYYKITGAQRSAITAGYFGLVAFLMAAMAVNGKRKKSPQVLERERNYSEVTYHH